MDIYACGECGTVYRAAEYAERCCVCRICSLPVTKDDKKYGIGYTATHQECSSQQDREKEAKQLREAVVIPDHDGPCFYGDTFYSDLESLIDYLVGESFDKDFDPENWPERVFIAEPEPFPKFTTEYIENQIYDEMFEDACDQVEGLEELQKAFDVFCEANKELITYHPSTKKVCLVPPYETVKEPTFE